MFESDPLFGSVALVFLPSPSEMSMFFLLYRRGGGQVGVMSDGRVLMDLFVLVGVVFLKLILFCLNAGLLGAFATSFPQSGGPDAGCGNRRSFAAHFSVDLK